MSMIDSLGAGLRVPPLLEQVLNGNLAALGHYGTLWDIIPFTPPPGPCNCLSPEVFPPVRRPRAVAKPLGLNQVQLGM